MKSQDLQKYQLPAQPGVYFFKKGREILYIGKATNLKSRVRSYFAGDIMDTRGPLIAEMREQANKIDWQESGSVLEALLLEAELIKAHQPKYNSKEKDDKSHNYIVITREDFPRVLIKRGRELAQKNLGSRNPNATFGPFPQGGLLRDALKIIRKIFPFRDTCTPFGTPGTESGKGVAAGKPCFNRQIGLCPGVCSGEISKSEYRKRINNIKMFLSGKKASLLRKLEREMRVAAQQRDFERAAELKRQIFALNHIQDIALLKNVWHSGSGNPNVGDGRIEGYDVAHMSGAAMLGVMTVVENGEANKNEYRKFNIKTVRGVNDTASLAEILERRFAHPEWQYPRVIVVDGGVAQKNAAARVLKKLGVEIPIMAVVKDERHKPRAVLGRADLRQKYEREILLANAEAHRFSIAGHRQKMRKGMAY